MPLTLRIYLNYKYNKWCCYADAATSSKKSKTSLLNPGSSNLKTQPSPFKIKISPTSTSNLRDRSKKSTHENVTNRLCNPFRPLLGQSPFKTLNLLIKSIVGAAADSVLNSPSATEVIKEQILNRSNLPSKKKWKIYSCAGASLPQSVPSATAKPAKSCTPLVLQAPKAKNDMIVINL